MEERKIPAGDRIDAEGFLVCGKCGTRKESMIPWPLFDGSGGMKQVRHRTLCRCEREKLEEEEAARKRREHDVRVKRLRSACFTGAHGRECTFGSSAPSVPNITKLAQAYVDRWQEMRERNIGYLFWGGVGSGKTHTAACIANALMEREVTVLMRNMNDFLDCGGAERSELTREIARCGLFILDDLGMERGTEYGLEITYAVVNARYESRRPTIITTNLPLKELKDSADPVRRRIYDRVLEMCVPVCFSGESLRPGISAEKMAFLKGAAG